MRGPSARFASLGMTAQNKKAVAVATASGNRIASNSRLGRIEAELRPAALGVGLGFPAALLVRSLEGTEPADFLQNSFGIQLVFQALQGPVHRFTFTNYHFRHVSSSFLKMSGFEPAQPSLRGRLAGVNYCE